MNHLPLGFAYSATYAGIRNVEKDDLALIVTGLTASAAGVFTQNRAQAAPVRLSRRFLAHSRGAAGAILINAGNANCATRTGNAVALETAKQAARHLRMPVTQVLVASIRQPMHVVQAAKLGAHVGTIPPAVLRQLFLHPLTDKGLAAFLADWAKTGQSILGENKNPAAAAE